MKKRKKKDVEKKKIRNKKILNRSDGTGALGL